MLAAMAFIAVGCTDDPLEPENPGQDGTEQTPGTGDNGEEPGENPGGENPGGENPGGENPGGENPGGEDPENPGENPEEPTLPGTEISLFDFAPVSVVERLREIDLMEITPSMAFKILEELKESLDD